VSYPIFPGKHALRPLLSAERMLEFRRSQGLAQSDAPTGVVICLYTGLMRRIGWRYRTKRVRGLRGDLHLMERTSRRVGVLGGVGIGAPAIVNAAEELLAWGTKRLVILSLAGGVRAGLAAGSVVVCDRAIRDEGTSYHYLPPSRDVRGSAALAQALSASLVARGLEHVTGATWSTDAPYRETKEEAEQFASEGIATVDMESAGLFAAAQVRGADAASLLLVGDSLAGPDWKAPPDMRALHAKMKLLLDAAIEAVDARE